jgi:hypothetical protein
MHEFYNRPLRMSSFFYQSLGPCASFENKLKLSSVQIQCAENVNSGLQKF